MKLGHRFYRDAFIKVAILSGACLFIFWDWYHGRTKAEPGVMPFLAVLLVVSNTGLFIAMRRAKRRELEEQQRAASAPPPTPSQFDEEVRKRKNMRRFMTCWIIGGGLIFVLFGKDWHLNGLPVPWVGYLMIGLGVLALLGVNVFYGGPLDLRLDRKPESSDKDNPVK